MSAPMQIARVAGRSVRFVAAGDEAAPVLLLVHAFPLGTRMFDPQRDAFPGWRVVAPALPGFDGSELLPRAHVDDYARHLVAFLDELGIERVVLGGVSLGGYLAFGILRQAPQRVSALILANTRSTADGEEARAGRLRMLEITQAGGPSAVASEMLPKLLGATSHRTRDGLVGAVRGMMEAQTAEGIAAAVHVLMSRPDSSSLLGSDLPALAIVGAEDVLTPPAEMRQMAAAMPRATFVEIEAAGHLANLENPGRFNDEVRRFLGSLAIG